METAEQAKAYIEKAIKVLPEDHHSYAFFSKFLKSFENAKELADNAEKEAILANAAVAVASRISMFLFIDELLSDELEKEYRTLPKPEETAKVLEEANKVRKDKYEELAKANKAAEDEQADIDMFQQVLGGRSVEEAKQKLEDYKNAGGR